MRDRHLRAAWRSTRTLTTDALRIASHWSGIGGLVARARGVTGAAVLMYHSVPSPAAEPWIHPEMRLSPRLFRAQMSFLARHRRVLAMSELVDLIAQRRPPPPGAVVLTLDDGYLDNLEVAAPILGALGLPAVLYLPTAYLEDGRPHWIDRLWAAFRHRTLHRLRFPGDGDSLDLSSPRAERWAMARARSMLIPSHPMARESLLTDIEAQLRPAGAPPRLTMTWDEARRLLADYPRWELGLHTRNHLDMTAMDDAAAAAEIAGGCADFQRHLGSRPVHFSFPYGRASDRLRAMLRAGGFLSAVASGPPGSFGAVDDPLRLSRASGHLTLPLLACWTGRGQRAFGASPG